MKKIATLFIVMLVFWVLSCRESEDPATVSPEIKDLLENTDFSKSTPSPWGFLSTGGNYQGQLTSEAFRSSNQSVMIEKEGLNPDQFAYWTQNYSGLMPVGEDLELEVFIKGDNLEGEGVIVVVATYDDLNSLNAVQFASTQESSTIDGTFDWTPFYFDIGKFE
jgi:hypothetical protein